MNPEFELKRKQQLIEDFLGDQFAENANYQVLLEAMRYSLLAGGKRLRPVLCMSFCELCGGTAEAVLPAAAAIEMVHTYSLIHDDLPCMDNDDYRRGRLTCHKVYGEDIATLAGDALLTAAFRYLTQVNASPEQMVRCVEVLSQAAGEQGMVAGQILDLAGEECSLSEEALRQVHRHKTGDLIRASCQMGVILGGGSEEQITAAGNFAMALGMAFQIRDDLLDCVGTQEQLGKPIGSDAENGKTTFITLFGTEVCQSMVESETAQALEYLNTGNFQNPEFVQWLAKSLIARMK